MTTIESVDTPIPLIDLERMQRNISRMAGYTRSHGLALRPHVKTHKSSHVAAAQLAAGAAGLTCATTREADVMRGLSRDLLIMYPPVGPSRLRQVLELAGACAVSVAVDSEAQLAPLATAARQAGRTIHVLVELDVGMRRVGIAEPDDAVALARRIVEAGEGVEYAGIAFYPGHVRDHVDAQQEPLREVNARLERVLSALARGQLAPRVVSGGSTPAAWHMHRLTGVTEVRPGTYVFNDRTTAVIGACGWDECALTVLATVVSTAVPGQAVLDAGSKALGREPLRAGASDGGFGALLEYPDAVVHAMSEEHGLVDLERTSWRPKVGDRVRIVPNHACIVVHLNDVMVAERGGRVEATLPVEARGRHGPPPHVPATLPWP